MTDQPAAEPPKTARVRAIEAHEDAEAERARQRAEDDARRAREKAEKNAELVARAVGGSPLTEWLPDVEWTFVKDLPVAGRGSILVASVEDDGNAEPLRVVLRPVGYQAGRWDVTVPDAVSAGSANSLAGLGRMLLDVERRRTAVRAVGDDEEKAS
mgnify:CR=1 FL=1